VWVARIRAADRTPPRLRLVCVAYAGGGPELFRPWAAALPPHIDLLALRLPGHGRRLRERPYRDWESLTHAAFTALAPCLTVPHAFYGHSFGARLAYELAHLAEAGYPGRTRRLFVSASRSPDSPQRRPLLHELPDADFRAAVDAMGGMSAEVLADEALARVLLPVLRAEIRLGELWGDRHGGPLAAPVTALYGRDDPVDGRTAMRGWTAFGGAGCELLALPGGHFFPDVHRRRTLDLITARLGEPDA
jgi:surfactin synthase thioesterase subunit